ncbi:hypothetical protein CANARDRAFT_26657 [[Candida] arabinofermentans NRRL YB-2248]|uniref:Homologous-pairing protein 2 winged helix domain-containing protein n=1 Tax=[Candida] arabinofermentans NRRL YB-2248 TaxID=983967 RepID=A0A1E4T656_9ASCO|nr:hypothetical protein CANARDRAFT_26657 [[Candida] arabinofermentans NRRL YB-2248]
MVRDYLKEKYRPFGVQDLILNLHSQIGKTQMIKILEELVSEKEIVSKSFGKTTFYCYREITDTSNATDTEGIITLEATNTELKQDYEELLQSLNGLKESRSRFFSSLQQEFILLTHEIYPLF